MKHGLKRFFLCRCTCVCGIVAAVLSVGACRTLSAPAPVISRTLAHPGVLTARQLTQFFLAHNQNVSHALVRRLAAHYVSEAAAEGINSDVAFAQMCLETGWLRFGGLVTADMHNYCGLGAIDASHPGERFATEALGVRAHIQHLHAYGTTDALHNALVDPRYRWVLPRGKAPTIYELSGTWAQDSTYGTKLDALLTRMETLTW
ncbi:MAG: glucosaminidase domain-containing protein [Treponema sp.]|nr:glucosaminidase domain-containing protein [Treponema sp.]